MTKHNTEVKAANPKRTVGNTSPEAHEVSTKGVSVGVCKKLGYNARQRQVTYNRLLAKTKPDQYSS